MPYKLQMASILLTFGIVFPTSQAQTVLLLTFNRSATSFCVNPAFTLAAFNVIFAILHLSFLKISPLCISGLATFGMDIYVLTSCIREGLDALTM